MIGMVEKVFGIGFHKTATKSLKEALEILGYKVTGPNGVQEVSTEKDLYKIVDNLLDSYNAFQDNPWPLVYEYLEKRYPNARFILTLRDESEWIKSVVKYFGNKPTSMRKFIYGYAYPLGNEKHYIERYKKHNERVLEYFQDKQEKLLILDITKGDGWEKLCPFLNKEIPKMTQFPHKNKNEKHL